MKILVFAERTQAFTELCAGARQLGERVEALVLANRNQMEEVKNSAAKVWFVPAQDGAMMEDYADTIAALLKKEKPNLMLVEPTKRCKLIAGRLAAMLGASVITDVMELNPEGEAKHMVYGGAALRREKAATPTAIATVGSGVLPGAAPAAPSQGEVETLEFIEPGIKMKVIGKEQKPKVSVDLPRAKKVIGVGRGIAKEDDLGMIRELAQAIGGEVGCSRPIAEGEKWMPKETYVGVSGLMLAPEVYVAVGISGQVQHVVGMNRSKVVIAINKEKTAPIFEQADYGIVGDLYKVVPALINHLK